MTFSVESKKPAFIKGLLAILAFAISVGLVIEMSRGNPDMPHPTAKVAFREVNGVRAGDDVRIAGVRVGRVQKVTLEGDRAVLTLQFDAHRDVYRDASATITSRSAMGQKYIELDPGNPAAGTLGTGEVVPEARNQDAIDVTGLFPTFDEKTRKATGSLLREVGGGAIGHSEDLHGALNALPGEVTDVAKVSTALTADDGVALTGMLNSLNELSGRFAGREGQISKLSRDLDTTLNALAVDNAKPVADTLRKAPDSITKLRIALEQVRSPLADLQSAAGNLRSGAKALGQATPDIRGILREAIVPLQKVPEVARQLEPGLKDLKGTFTDLGPVLARATRGFNAAQEPVGVLSPYAAEIAQFFTSAGNTFAEGDQDGHWWRALVLIRPEMIEGIGTVNLIDKSLVARDPYPAPGQAAKDRQKGLLCFDNAAKGAC